MLSIINNLRVIFAILTIALMIQSWASDPNPNDTSQTSNDSSSDKSSVDAYHKDNPMSHVMR